MRCDKVLSLFGVCAKAGNVLSGEFQTEKSVKEGKAYLVIVAQDASENTKKNFSDMCKYYKVPYAVYADKDLLGHSIGREFRASLAVVNEGLAKSLMKHLDGITTE